MIGGASFQLGNATGTQIVSSAVGYFAPVFEVIMAFLGVAFWISVSIFLTYYGIEAFAHPTPFGRASRLASIYDHTKGILWSIVAIYLTLAIIAYAVNQASAAAGAGTSISAGQLFYYIFVEPIVTGFKILFSSI